MMTWAPRDRNIWASLLLPKYGITLLGLGNFPHDKAPGAEGYVAGAPGGRSPKYGEVRTGGNLLGAHNIGLWVCPFETIVLWLTAQKTKLICSVPAKDCWAGSTLPRRRYQSWDGRTTGWSEDVDSLKDAAEIAADLFSIVCSLPSHQKSQWIVVAFKNFFSRN